MEGENSSGIVGSSKFTFDVPNFSRRSGVRTCSDIFVAGGCKWRLVLYPKENDEYDNLDYVSIFLQVAHSKSLPERWSREVVVSLALVNQFNESATLTQEFRHVFCAESKRWGYPYFARLSEIKSPAERFLVNDRLTVEAVVVVLSPVHYSNVYKKRKVSEPEPNKAPGAAVGAPIVPDTPVTVEPFNHSNRESEPTSKDEALVQTTSKRLITELSSRRKKHKPIFSDEILGSSQEQESCAADIQLQQKEALRVFFDMPLEAIQQADCFGKIEDSLHVLVQHTTDLQEKNILEDIMSRLANFESSIRNASDVAETALDRRSFLAGKTADLDSKMEQRQKELSSLESEFSTLSDEESKLRAQVDRVIAQKKSVSVKLEGANEEARKEIEEWRNLGLEMKKVNAEWVGAKEKLASANVHWDLLREDLGLAQLR